MKILLIDDDEALLTIFETALKQEGFSTVTATDGESGLQKAKTEKPDLILLDQILPDMRGNDIVKTLKAEEETKHIPMVVLSNFGQNELIKEAIAMGAVDYILKYQIEPKDLVQRVKELLQTPKTTEESQTS